MTDETTFLRAILADPTDDAIRLVYADWLLDQGELRGELVHVQVALAKGGLEPDREAELRRRERELLDEHGSAWLAPLRERGWEVAFRRGLPAPVLSGIHGKLGRVRPPRVRLQYEVPHGCTAYKELPFVIGVLADLGGHRTAGVAPLRERRFIQIDRDNFDQVLSRFGPELRLDLAGEGEVRLAFGRLLDFAPAAVAERIGGGQARLAAVLDHHDFRRLEATWRGLSYLVHQTETSDTLKIRAFDAREHELRADLEGASEPEVSALQRKVCSEEFDVPGGQPYGLLVGDYEFSDRPEDVSLLGLIARVMADAHLPFVAAASPEAFTPESLARRPEWESFRETAEAGFVALTLPRVLAPLPDGEGRDGDLWMNAGWAFAERVATAVACHGWPARICGPHGGKVEGLTASPVEVALSERRGKELAELGLLPLIHAPGRAEPVFPAATSCREGAPLDRLLCVSRFVHYLKVISRDRFGGYFSVEDYETLLNRWLSTYVSVGDAWDAGEPPLVAYYRRFLEGGDARRPLAEGRVEVREVPGRPGRHRATAWIRPTYQLEEAAATRAEFEI